MLAIKPWNAYKLRKSGLADQGMINPGGLLSSVDRYLAGDLSLAPALWATAAVDQWLTTRSPASPAQASGALR